MAARYRAFMCPCHFLFSSVQFFLQSGLPKREGLWRRGKCFLTDSFWEVPGHSFTPHIETQRRTVSGFSSLGCSGSGLALTLALALTLPLSFSAAGKKDRVAAFSSEEAEEVEAFGSEPSVTTEVAAVVWLEALSVANSTQASNRPCIRAYLSTLVEGRLSSILCSGQSVFSFAA